MPKNEEQLSQVDITDLYLASYLLLNGCKLIEVQCIPTGGTVSCRLLFQGTRLPELEDDFFAQKAVVNLLAFRSAYNQVNGYIHQAKKSFDREKRRDDPQRDDPQRDDPRRDDPRRGDRQELGHADPGNAGSTPEVRE